MVYRRSLLIGAGALVLGQVLAGCSRSAGDAALRIRLLENSLPVQLLGEFQRQIDTDAKLDFVPKPQLADLFELLNRWQEENQPSSEPASSLFQLPFNRSRSTPVADLVTLGDSWLEAAIRQALIQPLAVESISGWEQLPPAWQTLVRRDRQGKLSETGETWAAPYRWGSLVIAYRVEDLRELGGIPTDWADLWRPDLQGKISLLDSPRSVVGLTLKHLGESVNQSNLAAVPQLKSELQRLHQQVKFYSSDAYLQPLSIGDTSVAVGWSTDVLPVIERDRQLAAVIPASGTILTSDVWVRPAMATEAQTNLLQDWLTFCWQPDIARELSILSAGTSPILLSGDRTQLPEKLQNPLVLPSETVIQRSEFLEPLPAATISAYRRLWAEVRQTV